jgi:hypothetical protein
MQHNSFLSFYVEITLTGEGKSATESRNCTVLQLVSGEFKSRVLMSNFFTSWLIVFNAQKFLLFSINLFKWLGEHLYT